MKANSEQDKNEEDTDYMINILMKENMKLKQIIKNMASNNRSSSKSKNKKNKEDNLNTYNTILSMLEVLALQREKIAAVKKENVKMNTKKTKLLEKLKTEDFKYKTKQFMNTSNYSQKISQSTQRKRHHKKDENKEKKEDNIIKDKEKNKEKDKEREREREKDKDKNKDKEKDNNIHSSHHKKDKEKDKNEHSHHKKDKDKNKEKNKDDNSNKNKEKEIKIIKTFDELKNSKKQIKLLPSSMRNSAKNINPLNNNDNNNNIIQNSNLVMNKVKKIEPLKPNISLTSIKDLEYNFDNLMNLGLRGNKQYKK